jgi:predicted metalloprotease with PDZ domain
MKFPSMSSRFTLFAAAIIATSAAAQTAPIRITADLSEAPRRLYHAEIDIPVKSGPLTLTTPKWIPGNHRPTGPVEDITGVVFTANGETLKWRRDDIELYEFHLTIPKGVTSIHAHLDCIATSRVSDHMAVLEWEKLLLYPADTTTKNIPIEPSVTVLPNWGIGTALQPTGTGAPPPTTGVNQQYHQPPAGSVTTHFAATNVEQLEDSPVIAGKYFHEYPLATELPVKHYIDVVADLPGDEKLSDEYVARISNLVREANAAYGSHHYNVYHFLLTLSDVAGGEGLEHGQSSDNGENEKASPT